MQNRWVSFCLLMAFLFTSACGQGEVQPVSFMVFGEPAELKAYQDLVAAFEKQHPEIKV